jgi:hypothetical protein
MVLVRVGTQEVLFTCGGTDLRAAGIVENGTFGLMQGHTANTVKLDVDAEEVEWKRAD